MAIEPREAAVVLRIFQEFVEGQAESSIVKRMNKESVQGRFRSRGGWSPGDCARLIGAFSQTRVQMETSAISRTQTRGRRPRSESPR
jgi:hypothetical protein